VCRGAAALNLKFSLARCYTAIKISVQILLIPAYSIGVFRFVVPLKKYFSIVRKSVTNWYEWIEKDEEKGV
jgi:hypothetical protein